MTNYFTSLGTKPTIRSNRSLAKDDARPELLLDFYQQQPRPAKSHLAKVDGMFKHWCDLLFNKHNIIVTGHESKFKLLESFKIRYLDSRKLDGRKITTVRMHGFTPTTLEIFYHALFGITEGRTLSDKDRARFIDEAFKSENHYVFLLHSFEGLFRESKNVCDIIFQLCRECPDYFHIILSYDHVNGCKILNKLKLPLKFVSHYYDAGSSFFYERTHASLVEGAGQAAMIDQNFNLESLKDVHQAMQQSCQQVMVYILKYHVEQNHSGQYAAIPLEFNQLFQQCESRFWVRRANMLRAHLGELSDHSIIKVDGNTIHCLIDLDTCLKFLRSVGEEVTVLGGDLPVAAAKRTKINKN